VLGQIDTFEFLQQILTQNCMVTFLYLADGLVKATQKYAKATQIILWTLHYNYTIIGLNWFLSSKDMAYEHYKILGQIWTNPIKIG